MKHLKPLLDFLNTSPTAFHAVAGVKAELDKAGFTPLEETEAWELTPGKGYYVTRNGSALIAFRLPQGELRAAQIVASHSDSPTLKLKALPELHVLDRYTKLNVEGYGGMIRASWLDRPLSVAGRLVVRDGQRIQSKIIDLDEDLFLIPNQPIHLNREINEGYSYNVQKDLLPLVGGGYENGRLMAMIAEKSGVVAEHILAHDLFLYNRNRPSVWGLEKEYFSSVRIDNLECAYTSLQGFLSVPVAKNLSVYALFDNEEVGSTTKQGAAGTFLRDVLRRVVGDKSDSDYARFIAASFMVSADNAHACHPNFPEKSDEANRVFMNEGIVLKHSANQKYTTDAVSQGIFKAIMDAADIPTQDFVNRSDIVGGSTLGSIANTQVSLNTVDIGLAQLAMHSAYETAGVADVEMMVKGMKAFYEARIIVKGDGDFSVE